MGIEGYMVAVPSALLTGLLPALIAASKGRRFLLWWLYGATVIFVALPHALLAKERAVNGGGKPRKQAVRTCPSCSETLPPFAVACRYCGTAIGDGPGDAPDGPSSTDSDVDDGHAGPLRWSDADFARISAGKTAMRRRSAGAGSRSKPILSVLAGMAGIVILAGGIAAFGLSSGGPAPVDRLAVTERAPIAHPHKTVESETSIPSPAPEAPTAAPAAQSPPKPSPHSDGRENVATSAPEPPPAPPHIPVPKSASQEAVAVPAVPLPPLADPAARNPGAPKSLTPRSITPKASAEESAVSPEQPPPAVSDSVPEPPAGSRGGARLPSAPPKVSAVGELVYWMQRRLSALGYFRGNVNGRAGPDTRRAIAAYQRDHDLTPTGQINEALIVSLRRKASASPPSGRRW